MITGQLVRRLAILALPFVTVGSALAEAPAGYYSTCEGKKGAALLSALCDKISSHTNVGYDGLWNVYTTSDVRPNGKVWDMYSTKEWTVGQQHCGNYSKVGDCINREHSVPQSWFNSASPMKADAFHVYPTDGKVNGQRSNYPYGECVGGTNLGSNGNVKALGRLGKSTFAGYSGTVFEPDDEYKGDFARTYFYMAACYNDKVAGWSGASFAGNKYPVFSTWTTNLLLKWHRQDPVSDKERDRNEAVYAKQKNRNPFIDYPELAEHIWGDATTIGWAPGGEAKPAIATPVNGSSIDMGLTGVNTSRSLTITVKGQNIKENVGVSISGAGFSTLTSTLSPSAVNSSAGASLPVSLKATSAGTYTATLTLTSGTAKNVVTLTASAVTGIPALDPVDIGEDGFTARWVYVDDACATYSLHVTQNGQEIAGYPVNVPAENEEWDVTGLTPGTTYIYYLTSIASGESNKVSVTTAVPTPSIQFLFDGDLYFTSEPGTPSEIAELLLDTDNIEGDITLSVISPFQLSTDRTNWSNNVVLKPEEERFYLRMLSECPGEFETEIAASSANYETDNVTVHGVCTASPTFLETFEPGCNFSYTGGTYKGAASNWTFVGAMVGNDSRDRHSGSQGARMNKTAGTDSYFAMAEGKPHGVGSVTFYAKAWDGEGGDVSLDYSNDGGISWTPVKTFTISDDAWHPYTATVNAGGDVRLRLNRLSGKRMSFDDLEATDYALTAVAELEYHAWDAYCLDGQLVIEVLSAEKPLSYSVHSPNGAQWATGNALTTEAIDLPTGIYLVTVNGFTRKVIIK